MDKKILEFDDRIVDKSEIIEQVKFYIEKSEEGLNLLSKGDNNGASKILKELRNNLNLEYNYYNKSKIRHIIFVNKDYNDYSEAISDSIVNNYDENNSEAIGCALEKIEENMKSHCGYLIN